MSFKKSNIYFDEKPTKGSKNAITSGAVAENSGGIPIYKKAASFSIQNPSETNKNVSIKLTFTDTTELHDFAKRYICIGVGNIESFLDNDFTQPFEPGKYVNVGITANHAEIASNIITPDLYYSGVAKPTFSVSSTIVYYKCDLIFVDVNDLTNFE